MRKVTFILLGVAMCWFAAYAAHAAELNVPGGARAGSPFTIDTSGSGDAVFYLIGPAHASTRKVRLGQEIKIEAEDVRGAGRYTAVLRSGESVVSKNFFVSPGPASSLNFLARPSRVPAAKAGVITGVAFVFDDYKNLALAPTPVKFDLSVANARAQSRTVASKYGISWTRLDSGRTQGAAQFVASLAGNQAAGGAAAVRRVVQQVAADACNLRIKAERTERAIIVETDPVRDCAGNPVPDGTIVSFTQVDDRGRSTVDARVKRDIARAELPLSDNATISVAAGVVMGNELKIGGGR